MDSAENFSEGGYGGLKVGTEAAADVASFHFANEKREKGGGPIRKNTTVLRRRNVSKAVTDDPRDSFESIRHKLSAISGPEVNNNLRDITELYSTPVGKGGNEDELKSCSGLGKSPAADSGFVSTLSSASKLSTPIKSLFSSPNEKYIQEKKKSSYSHYPSTFSSEKVSSSSKRLFETSSQRDMTVFGVRFKLDEVIPLLVLVFVALSAVVTVTTLTSALRRSHDITKPAPNGKYRSIQFAYDQLMKEDDKFQVVDEYGNALGGKKAAIQFAHDLRMKEDDEFQVVDEYGNALGGKKAAIQFAFDLKDTADKVDIQRHFDTLDLFKTIGDMAENVDSEQPEVAKVPEMTDDEKRDRLLKHIASFGSPFATSQVAILRKKRAAAKKSKNNNPFAAFKNADKKKAPQISPRDVVELNNFRFR